MFVEAVHRLEVLGSSAKNCCKKLLPSSCAQPPVETVEIAETGSNVRWVNEVVVCGEPLTGVLTLRSRSRTFSPSHGPEVLDPVEFVRGSADEIGQGSSG